MKKWMYLVFPGIMLALFLVVYTTHKKEVEEREAMRARKVQEKLEDDKKQKEIAEARAAEDAKKRAAEREAEDRKKEEDRRRKQAAIDKDIADETARFKAEGDKNAKDASNLEIELDRLHKQKDALGREDFELAKQVELARVAKRNAELQEQHLTAMIAQRADMSTMAKMPPPPPAK